MIGKSIGNTDTATDGALAQRRQPTQTRSRGAGFALFIAAIALFFTVVGIAAGYKHWQRMHDRAKDNARRIEVMEVALAAKMDSRDLAALMTLPVSDVTIVSAKVNQLLAQLPSHKEISRASAEAAVQSVRTSPLNEQGNKVLMPEAAGKASDANSASTGTNASLWSVGKQRALAMLSHVVAVQKIEPSAVAALEAGEQEALHSLLRLRLESLRLMALQGDKRAYQQQISLLRNTLETFAVYVPQQLAGWRNALDDLAAVDLQSKGHDISGGLRQLRQSQRENLAGTEQ